MTVLTRLYSASRFATLSSLPSSNAGPPRPPIAADDDDDDDEGSPREGESWFAGGERRYAYTPLYPFLSMSTFLSVASLYRTQTRAKTCPAGGWCKTFYSVLLSGLSLCVVMAGTDGA